MVLLQSGHLLTSDEASIIYLVHMNEQQRGSSGKFILQHLDSKSLFVSSDRVPFVRALLAARLNETVFEEAEEEAQRQLQKRKYRKG